MDHFTVLPFMLALLIGVAGMPTNVVQVCYGEMGIEHEQRWRAKTLNTIVTRGRALARRVSALFTAWRGHPLAMPAAALVLVLAISAIAPHHADGAQLAVAGVVSLKELKQAKADNDAAQARLKSEGRTLLGVAADRRTTEQAARLDSIDAELNALTANAATIATDLARAERWAEEERRAGTLDANDIQPGADRGTEKPWGPRMPANASAQVQREVRQAALGEFAIAVKKAACGEGADPRLFAAASGMNTMNMGDGGFAVPPEVAPGIESGMFAGGEILSRVDARTISGDAIAYNVIDETSRATGSRAGGVQGYWVDQGTAPTASQTKLARIELKLRKVATLGYMTDELVADAAALGGELESAFVDELIFQVEDAVVEGTGAGQPLGYQNAPCLVSVAKETGQAAATIVVANLSKMWARIPARSKSSVVWLINVDTEPILDLLTIPAGTAAVEPRFVTYAPDGTLNIKGRPVVRVEYCATLGTVGDIACVDLSRYRLIRKGGPETASSIHVRFTQGEQTFKATYRVDGQPVPRSAITPFKGTNTLSPFVVLATR